MAANDHISLVQVRVLVKALHFIEACRGQCGIDVVFGLLCSHTWFDGFLDHISHFYALIKGILNAGRDAGFSFFQYMNSVVPI